ncbi:MAG: FkbM family methyltransferase [bacterium]|nr:FkbM family methyltransferase [bacterium]
MSCIISYIMQAENIVIHHIGGRDGRRSFPLLPRFERDFVNVLYDADPSCAEQMASANKKLKSKLIVLPKCVGGKNGAEIFNINYDPYTSSLRAISPSKKNWYFYFRKWRQDVILGEVMSPMEKMEVKVTTMDELLINNKKIPPPDFLSLDTQGTEFEILRASSQILKENVLAVVSEVSFQEIYKKQKLFGDVSKLLSDQGFFFVKFTKYILDCSPFRYPKGLRGEGFQTATDALYLRNIKSVLRVKNKKKRVLMLEKLAFFACVFGQFEYSLECLNTAYEASAVSSRGLVYQRFLRKLYRASKQVPQVFAPTFKEEFTFEQSKARFNGKAELDERIEKPASPKIFRKTPDTSVEKLLRNHGLLKQADALKCNRLL